MSRIRKILIIIFLIVLLVIIFNIWYWGFYRTFSMYISSIEKYDHNYIRLPKASGGRTVISLTSIPSRIDHIKTTLNSLLDQTVRVDEISLNLPRKTRRGGDNLVIPNFLKGLRYVKIYLIDEDQGPATKLLPTLRREKEGDTRIIYLDDDMVYNKSLIETLVNHSNIHPNLAIANRAWNVKDYLETGNGHNDKDNKGVWDVAMGYAGVLVKPKFFTDEVYHLTIDSAFYADDVWISGHLAKNGVEICHVNSGGYYFRPTGLISALSQESDHRRHDKVLIDYFWPHWKTLQ